VLVERGGEIVETSMLTSVEINELRSAEVKNNFGLIVLISHT